MVSSHILIIDDDIAMLKALPEVLRLKMENLKIDVSDSPHQALSSAAKTDYDAIISDINMPGIDGLTLLTQLRTLRPTTPVLLMTSYDERDLVVQALRGGAYDFVQKPIDEDYLVASLQRAIQMRELSREVAEQRIALERHAKELEQAVQQAVAETQATQRRMAFLAEASTLLASSLDYEVTLSRVARLAVLYLADYCIMDVVNEESVLECVGTAHVNRTKEFLVRKLRKLYQAKSNQGYPALGVLQRGKPVLYSEFSYSMLEASAVDDEQLQVLQELSPRSLMMVPLVAGERILGVLTFVSCRPDRHYNGADLALAEDLTRRAVLAVDNARLYNEAQQALRIRDQFLSIAAHELKTPMTSILGTSQLLLRRAERGRGTIEPRDMTSLRLLITQTQRLNRLVDSLLNIARLEAGQLTIEKDQVDIVALARRVVEEINMAFDTHTIELHSPEEHLLVSGDELRLEQVLQNLLQNAIKYSPDGGTIQLGLEQEGEQARISVTDQGVGIPSNALPQLFSRFFRAENPEGRRISGIGLGLYVVKEIVTLHGGKVEVKSTEGQGSTFTVSLPALQPQPLQISSVK